jgi:hypothetical protein
MNAAFSAVPAMSGDREFECGMGVGRYDSKNAIATSCGARISEQVTTNIGASFLPGGSESFLLGKMPSVAFRALSLENPMRLPPPTNFPLRTMVH